MKLRYLFAFVFIVPTFVSAHAVDFNDVVKRNGIYYKKFSDVPIKRNTDDKLQKYGKRKDQYYEEYYSNGQLASKGIYRNDAKYSVWEWYNNDGKLKKTETYYDSGKLKMKKKYKDGKVISQTCFLESGEKAVC